MDKQCTKCKEIKPLSEFSTKGTGENNFSISEGERASNRRKNSCKACDAAYAREFRKRNKNYTGTGKISKYTGEERLLMSAIRRRLNEANGRDRKYDRPEGNLDDEYLMELYKQQQGLCAYLGIPLKIEKGHPATLSLDKKDPAKGYNKGNVQWLCWAVNRAKGDLTEADFLRMCSEITERSNDYRTAGNT